MNFPSTLTTPVVLLIYNRPQLTSKVFDIISQVSPAKLYIVADGPLRKVDISLCQQTRNIVSQVDWPCQVKRIYSQSNLGLRKRVITGLNQIFQNEETAIILEDDCIPDLSYFRYCEELLDKYANDTRILSIAGFNNYPSNHKEDSYYFSRYVESWGWATWKRAWELYSDDMADWPNLRTTDWLYTVTGSFWESIYWKYIFDLTYKGKYNSWAYRWMYTAFQNKMVTIIPKTNLISNIGFGNSATNTKISVKLPKTNSIRFPLKHPKEVTINEPLDMIYSKKLYQSPLAVLGLVKKFVT